MSTALAILPRLWACEAPEELVPPTVLQPHAALELVSSPQSGPPPELLSAPMPELQPEPQPEPLPVVEPEIAFYRKYTEAMLRRYIRLSMAFGRAPSLLGRELFRGKVTNYRVQCFDDVVIFSLDVEHCLARLAPLDRLLLRKIAIQEYTPVETAEMLQVSHRNLVRRYYRAVDTLTDIFLQVKLLEPLKACQGGNEDDFPSNY